MRGIFKVIIVMAVISLAAYALHLYAQKNFRPAADARKTEAKATVAGPRVTAQMDHANAAGDALGGGVAPVNGLVYPHAAARRAMGLKYAVFQRNPDGSMMALPLPPGSAWPTMLALDSVGRSELVMSPQTTGCAFPVAITVYRADRAGALWHGELPPHGAPSKPTVVNLVKIGAGNPVLVTLKMAGGAKNNYSCNVELHWAAAPPANS